MKIYAINRAVGQQIEFRGLKARYLGRLGMLVMGLIVMSGVMHLLGVSSYLIVLLVPVLGGMGIKRLYRLSRIYGQHGLMKKRARRSVPSALCSRSRRVFIQLIRR